jgi:hypothetical protein
MFEVRRDGRVFDIQHVLDALEWAYKRSQSEDEMFAARNVAATVNWSPLTRQLEQAYSTLLEMRMWTTEELVREEADAFARS